MIVERFGPAIYLKRRIQFTSQPPLPADDDPAIEVPFDGQPFADEGKLTQDAKQAVLTAIQARSQKTGHVHCLVLTPAIGLYVYPGKSIVTKGIPPRSSAPTPIKVVKR